MQHLWISVLECVKKAQEKGVIIDSCNGRVHWSFENLKNGFADGFFPDIISSDLVCGIYTTGFSLIHAMGVLSAAGMKTEQILKAITYNPANALGIRHKAGTLKTGKPANIAIFYILDDSRILEDMFGGKCKANKMFCRCLQ